MPAIRERQRARLEEFSRRIIAAQKPIRVLKAITWSDAVRNRFFAQGGRELPRPVYPPLGYDPERVIAAFADIVAALHIHDPIERMLMESCVSYIDCVRMLARRGTRDFYLRSAEIYGRPSDAFDSRMTELDLALHFDRALRGFTAEELSPEPPRSIPAARAVRRLRQRFERTFGADDAPRVRLGRLLVSDAAAGADVIKLKTGRMFSARSLGQLEQHEGYVHAATTLNGRRQPVLRCLGKGAPRTASCQEGLAVFAELVSRELDVLRLSTIKDRVIAIRMAEEGADFIQIYRFFRESAGDDGRAFDNARRVVRGGMVEGGAPFTKDVVYLGGLVRIYTWARLAMRAGRPELLRFLWVGKVALEDVPALWSRHLDGLVDAPQFLPDWARDVHHLAAYMCFSAFLDRLDSGEIERRYQGLLLATPAQA